MGYSTDFIGRFDLDRQLQLEDYIIINELADLRPDERADGMPDTWCQWAVTRDGRHIEWNGGEKFYYYQEWLQWIVDYLESYTLSGSIEYQGEETGDSGTLVIENGKAVLKPHRDAVSHIAQVMELIGQAYTASNYDDSNMLPFIKKIEKILKGE